MATSALRPLLPRPLPFYLPAVLLPLSLSLIIHPLLSTHPHSLPALEASFGFSLLAFLASLYVVPALGPAFVAKGFKGRDLLKVGGAFVPESMGLPIAAIYILLLMLFIPYPFTVPSAVGPAKTGPFPHEELTLYLSALLSLLTATLLGFLDDVFDIRWRHKLPIPIVASIPLLLVYYAQGGLTAVVMPKGLRGVFGTVVELGPLYYVYMSLLSTFSTNSINILAGINGIEVSQSLIIALSVVANDLLYLPLPRIDLPYLGEIWEHRGMSLLGVIGGEEMVRRHLLSLYFMLPLVGVCAGLLYHNWYPSRAFPGDTFCYFTGMTFSCVAILSHFPKTLLLFFIPQIFNFILSCPQLFGLVNCPRHRLPKLDESTGLLNPSRVTFPPSPAPPPPLRTVLSLEIFSALRLVQLERETTKEGVTSSSGRGRIRSSTNLTILNFLLVHLGSMREDVLTKVVITIQIAGSLLAFFVRYGAVRLFYDGDRK